MNKPIKKFERLICSNRKAYFEYEILDTIEAGIVLIGCEVKSLIGHKASLDGAYGFIENGELWMHNAHIDEYVNKITFTTYNPIRKRKLLLKKAEIRKWAAQASQKGFTIIPLDFHLANGKIKVKLGIAKGKQLHDKRQADKKRDAAREIQQYE
jgi:SsrA-binding protein